MMGMNASFVMSEEQILKKRKAAENKKLKANVKSKCESEEMIAIECVYRNYQENMNEKIVPEEMKFHREFFRKQLFFEQNSEHDLCLQLNRQSRNIIIDKMKFIHLADLTNASFNNIIRFIKNIPEFNYLETENQVKIIRSCIFEIHLVNLAQFYDETRDVLTIGNTSYSLSMLAETGIPENAMEKFKSILLAFDRMQLTEKELSLLLTTIIFSEDRGYNDQYLFEIQERYAFLLQKTLDERQFKRIKNRFPELIFLLSSIRCLSIEFRPFLQALTNQFPDCIPPLIKEIYD